MRFDEIVEPDGYAGGERLFRLSFTSDELAFLSNAVSVSIGAIENWEYQSLTGLSPEVAGSLAAQMHEILSSARGPR